MHKFFIYWLFIFFIAASAKANPVSISCVKVKIFTKSNTISFNDRNRFVLHFQLENCGNQKMPIDFYANLGYPEDSTSNIYFEIMKADNHGKFFNYKYAKVDYKNGIDSVMQLKPRGIYSFYLPLFEVYDIKDAGTYRLQGFYRFINDAGEYIIGRSEYLDIIIK